jgi:hypothetical protein
MVSDGKLTVGGNFREFARLTPRLIQIAENAGFWGQVGLAIEDLARD